MANKPENSNIPSVNVASLLEENAKLRTELDESKTVIEKLTEQLSKPSEGVSKVECDGVTYQPSEENQAVKSIYHGGVQIKIEEFTKDMVEHYVESGFLVEA